MAVGRNHPLVGRYHRRTQTHLMSIRVSSFKRIVSSDGRTLASGSGDDTIRLWDAVTGAHKQTLTGHTDAIMSVAFSPDGGTLASGSIDKTIRLWDTVTGDHRDTLTGHTDEIKSVSFSPDEVHRKWEFGMRPSRLWDSLGSTQTHTHEASGLYFQSIIQS